MTHAALGLSERLLKRRLFLPSRLLRLSPGAETSSFVTKIKGFNVFIFFIFVINAFERK
jgi:hypothetical protein